MSSGESLSEEKANESPLRSLFSSGLIYALSAVAQKALQFLLLPVYARVLTSEEFGIQANLQLLSALLFGTLALGLPSAILKCYHRDFKTEYERQRVLGTALLLALPVLMLGTVTIWLSAPWISNFLLKTDAYALLVRIAACTGFFAGILALINARIRAEERAVAYCISTFTQFLLALVLNILFVVQMDMGVQGILLGNLLSNAAVVPLAFWLVRQSSTVGFKLSMAKPLLHFGIQLVPTFFAAFVIDQSDRWFVTHLVSLEAAGIYYVGYQVGMVLQLAIVWPFQLAWPAFAFGISNEDGHRATFAKMLSYLIAAMAWVILGLSLASRAGLELLVTDKLSSAYRVVPLIAVAYAMNGIQHCVAPAIHIHGKTRYLSYLTALAAALNLLLNTFWVPRWGMMGAAYATICSLSFVAVGAVLCAERLHRISYEYVRILKAVVPAVVIFLLATRLPALEVTVANVVLYVLLILAYPLTLLAIGFLSALERREIADTLSSRLGALRKRFSAAE